MDLISGQTPGQDECQVNADCDVNICVYNCAPGTNTCFFDTFWHTKRCRCCPEWEAIIHPPPVPPPKPN